MAALSTLRTYRHECDRSMLRSPQSYSKTFSTATYERLTEEDLSILHIGHIARPIENLFGSNGPSDTMSSSRIVSSAWQEHGHLHAPTDGESMWFCSECGDGPYGTWQVNCACCQHHVCPSCPLETK